MEGGGGSSLSLTLQRCRGTAAARTRQLTKPRGACTECGCGCGRLGPGAVVTGPCAAVPARLVVALHGRFALSRTEDLVNAGRSNQPSRAIRTAEASCGGASEEEMQGKFMQSASEPLNSPCIMTVSSRQLVAQKAGLFSKPIGLDRITRGYHRPCCRVALSVLLRTHRPSAKCK